MNDTAADKNRYALPWIWRGIKGKRAGILLLCLLRVASALCGVFEAVALRSLINSAVAGDKAGFVRYCLVFGGLMLVQILMWAAARYLDERVKATVENRLKSRLFNTLLKKDFAAVSAVHSGEWMNRLTSDAVVVAGSAAEIIPNLLGTAARLVGALSLIIYFIRQVACIIIPAAIVIGFLTFFLRRKLKVMHKRIQESDGRLRIFLTERLSSLMIVRSFAMEEESLAQAEERMDDHFRRRMERVRFLNICNIGFNLLIHGMYVAAVIYCGHGILTGAINYGTFAAVVNLVGQLKSPIAGISGYIPRWYSMLASAERLMEAESFEDDIKGRKRSRKEITSTYDECFEGISLKDVSFSYTRMGETPEDASEHVVLDGISFDIDRQQTVAVTGPSGCGKSTLLKLLMCFYPLDGGERMLRLHGFGEAALDPSWRGLFAYVPQGNQLMSGSIRDVLTFGDSGMSDEEIKKALDIACASEFVSILPKGLDTELGERGSGLSEGQIQRLAIARAVLSGHPLLLLDEATSSLDEATEEELLEKVRTLTDRTVVIVTHRLKVLSICDTEVHMDENGVSVRSLKNV